jgi:hypothetical protein
LLTSQKDSRPVKSFIEKSVYDGGTCLQPLSRESTTGQLLCFKLIERGQFRTPAPNNGKRARETGGRVQTGLEQFGNLILSPLLALKLLPLLDGAQLLLCSWLSRGLTVHCSSNRTGPAQ